MNKCLLALLAFVFIGCANKGTKDVVSIDRDKIRQAIQERIKEYKKCYDLALKKNPHASGKIEVKWLVKEGGKADKTQVFSSDFKDPEMENCVVGIVATTKFPEPPKEQIAEVKFPFVFSPNATKKTVPKK